MPNTAETSKVHRLRGQWLERPSGRVRVWTAGSGPTILAIHGLGGSGRYWDGLARRVGHRFTVVAPDLPGFGASYKPPIRYDRELHLGVLDAVVDRFGPSDRAVVVGHSVGGVLAVLYGGSRPNGVHALALTATPYPEPSRRPGPDPTARLDAVGRSLRGRAVSILVRAVWPAVSVPVALVRHYPFAVVRDYGRQTLRGRSWTLWSLLHDPTIGADLDGAERGLGSDPGSTLLLHASDDRTVSVGAVSAWARRFPRAEQLIVPTGGHQVLLTTKFEPLVRWLDGLPG